MKRATPADYIANAAVFVNYYFGIVMLYLQYINS